MNNFFRHLLKQSLKFALLPRLNRFARELVNPHLAQEKRWREIITANAPTEFGRAHNFSAMNNIDDYRRHVPISDYATFAASIERMKNSEQNILTAQPIEMFAITSGTTAQAKYIPLTRAWTREHHYIHLNWLWSMMNARPLSIVGSILSLISPAQSSLTSAQIPCGASSGKQYRDQNIPQRKLHCVPYPVFLINDYHTKYYVILLFALAADLRCVNSVNPSTLILLATMLAQFAEPLLDDLARGQLNNAVGLTEQERAIIAPLLKPRPQRARELREILISEKKLLPRTAWKNIGAINTWQGGCAPFYLPRVCELWGNAPQRCWGLRATEGIFSVPLNDHTASGVIAVGGHFIEFAEGENLPSNHAATLLAHELQIGKRYRIILTNSGGLYRYDMGDIVEVTGVIANTPTIAFLHKAGGMLSITGEKVSETQINVVFNIIAREVFSFTDFSVSVKFAEPPFYQIIIEPLVHENIAAEKLTEICATFDRELSLQNLEYREKRDSGRLAPPQILMLPKNSYQQYREYRVKNGVPDGQIKPPHLIKPEKLEEFLQIVTAKKN